jgi:hypothetical protein
MSKGKGEIMASNTTVLMRTPTCAMCGKGGFVEVFSEGYMARKKGASVQDAFSELDMSLREQIISGTHPKCWESMVAGLENE